MKIFSKCEVNKCYDKIHANLKKIGYCKKHYLQIYRHNKIFERTRYDFNEIIDRDNYYEIILYSGCGEQKEIARTLIDKEDLEKIKNYKWCLNGYGYVMTKINGKTTFLHRLIFNNLFIRNEIDHRNGNKLDNRKNNLRLVTHQQNQMNRKSEGYCWHKKAKKWMVYITANEKQIYLGLFEEKQEAIVARKRAEVKYFKEFRYNN